MARHPAVGPGVGIAGLAALSRPVHAACPTVALAGDGLAGRRSDIGITGDGVLSQKRICTAFPRSFATGNTVPADEHLLSAYSSHNHGQHGRDFSAEKYFKLETRDHRTDCRHDGDQDRIERVPLASFCIKIFLSPFFFKDRTPHFIILVKDWMGFITELDSKRTGGGMAVQKIADQSILSRLPKQ